MSRLSEMRSLGLPVTWATVRAGWEGVGRLGRQLTAADLEAFACQELEHACGTRPEIAELCAGADEETIGVALARLAPNIPSRAIRTWRAFQLTQLLKELPESPVDGLSELTAFWNALDFPQDMPHVVQGLGNDITPNEYYTQENYRYLVDRHKAWLRSEIAAIADAP
jgi:hypothetical protein